MSADIGSMGEVIIAPETRALADPEAAWPVRKAVVTGLSLSGVTLGFFLFWSVFAPLASAVVAPGEVIGAANRQLIQHLEGGVVRSILVKDGDRVRAGDVLVRLDDRMIRADLAAAELGLAETGYQLQRLAAEGSDADHLTLAAASATRLADPVRAEAIRAEQQALFTARQATAETIGAELASQIAAARNQMETSLTQAAKRQDEAALVRTELARQQGLLDRKLGTEGALFTVKLQLAQSEAAIAQLQAVATQAEDRARQLEAERDRRAAERREVIRTETVRAQGRATDLTAQAEKLRAALARTEIRAPASGIVTSLALHTVGGIVAPGQQLGQIAPEDAPLVISVTVSPQDVDRIRPGQPARVRFPAFNQRRTPELTGSLRTIAADRTTTPDGKSFYAAEVTLDTPPPAGMRLLPGMQAEVFIQNGERSLMSYLIKPLTDALSRSMKEE